MKTLGVNRVSKTYDDITVLEDVSLDVAAGECVALLGHNGAGKTTLFKMILGLLEADGGKITVAGHAAGSIGARRVTAYLPESVAFHRLLSGREQLRFFAGLRRESSKTADRLLERVGLGDAADRRIGTYSKGMRQRLGLAQAMLGDSKVVLLDEPTSGLDPIARSEFYGVIREMTDRGAAVLLSSHALAELAPYADRIAMLRKGKLVAHGTLQDLRHRASLPVRLRVVANDGRAESVHGILGGQRVNGRSVELSCAPEDKLARITEISAHRDLIEDIEVLPPDLDDLYRYFSSKEA